MLRLPEFDSKEIDPDLHKQMEKAVLDGRIKCFNMREGPADGDQDLDFWTREMEDVVLEIMEDPISKAIRSTHLRWTWMRLAIGCLAARQMQEWHFR